MDEARIDLPLTGEWFFTRPPGHQLGAWDLVAASGASPHLYPGSLWSFVLGLQTAGDSPAWGCPVLAPCSGEVAKAIDAFPDHHRLNLIGGLLGAFLVNPLRVRRRPLDMAGNCVIIRSDDGYAVLLAHLRRGSVAVTAGTRVEAGEKIGEIGNSGNSVAPHLHLQAMSGTDPLCDPVLPLRIRSCQVLRSGMWETVVDYAPRAGERVRSVSANRT